MPQRDEKLQPAPPFEPGIYEHFKGGKYLAVCVARSSEKRNAFFVQYLSLESGFVMTRPYASDPALPDSERNGFTDYVMRPEYQGLRFRKVEVTPARLAHALRLYLPAAFWDALNPQPPVDAGGPAPRTLFGDAGAGHGPYGSGY